MEKFLRRGGFVTVIVAISMLLWGCERYALDRQMEELCKKDGGVKVYERVDLPENELALVREGLSHGLSARAGGYRFISKAQFIVGQNANPQKGEGQLRRVSEAIYRESDNKLLVEQIAYDRSGGDWMTFGFQPSGNYCPRPRVGIVDLVFSEKR